MKNIISRVLWFIVVAESLIFMVPATLLLVAGIVLSILGFSQGNRGAFTPAYLYVLTFLVFLGFALYSVWWLIICYRKIILSTIPIHIWLGLLGGAIVTILIFSPFRIEPPTSYISSAEFLRTKLVFGLGPFITTITLLLIIHFQKGSNKALQHAPSALDSL